MHAQNVVEKLINLESCGQLVASFQKFLTFKIRNTLA